jgi:sRNA-binding protein
MAEEKYEPVVFLDAAGSEISNDPVWHAQKTLRSAGVSFDNSQPDAQARRLEQANATTPDDDDELEAEDAEPEVQVDDDGNRTYKELKAAELKSLANSRGVDIKGAKTVGDVRKALVGADAKDRETAADNAQG